MKQRIIPRKGDVLALLAILLLAGGTALFFLLGTGTKSYCVIRQSRAIIKVLPMDEDADWTVGGAYENTVTIRQGRVWVSQSSCPNQACKKMGERTRAGQTIVCLPNQVVIEVRQDVPSEVDAIAR